MLFPAKSFVPLRCLRRHQLRLFVTHGSCTKLAPLPDVVSRTTSLLQFYQRGGSSQNHSVFTRRTGGFTPRSRSFPFSYTPNHESEPNMIKQLRAAAAIAVFACAGAAAVRAQEVTQPEKDRRSEERRVGKGGRSRGAG